MTLKVSEIATSVVYGGVDIATEYIDQQMKLSGPFTTVTDIQRTVAAVGGAIGGRFVRGSAGDVLDTVAIAAIPSFEKTMVNAVMSFMGQTTRFAPRGSPRGQILVKRPGAATSGSGNIPGVVF